MELLKIKWKEVQKGYEMKEKDDHDDRNAFILYVITMNQSFMYYEDSCTAGWFSYLSVTTPNRYC